MCSDSDLPHDDINIAVVAFDDDDDEFNARAYKSTVIVTMSQPFSAHTEKETLRRLMKQMSAHDRITFFLLN